MKRFRNWFRTSKVYILPTWNGIKFIFMNVLLLIIGLLYGNNFILMFNFLLFSLVFCSMIYTHYNLERLSIVSIQIDQAFAQTPTSIQIAFANKSLFDKFEILVRPYNTPKLELESDRNITMRKDTFAMESITGIFSSRGIQNIEFLRLETTFPFGFFRTFSYHQIDQSFIIYPKPLDSSDYLRKIISLPHGQEDSDIEIKSWHLQDRPNRILWKKIGKELLTRHEIPQGSEELNLHYSHELSESELSTLTSLVLKLSERKIPFKITAPKFEVQSRGKKDQLKDVLRQLGTYAT